jgi:hypothetical protein
MPHFMPGCSAVPVYRGALRPPSSPKFRTDPLADLQKMVRQENIRNGVILSALGSARRDQGISLEAL